MSIVMVDFIKVNPIVQIFASGAVGWIIDRYHWKYLSGFGLVVVSAVGFLMGCTLFAVNFTLIICMGGAFVDSYQTQTKNENRSVL